MHLASEPCNLYVLYHHLLSNNIHYVSNVIISLVNLQTKKIILKQVHKMDTWKGPIMWPQFSSQSRNVMHKFYCLYLYIKCLRKWTLNLTQLARTIRFAPLQWDYQLVHETRFFLSERINKIKNGILQGCPNPYTWVKNPLPTKGLGS